VKTTTQTQVAHYEIQKNRRLGLLEEWRGYHKTVLKRADVVMHAGRVESAWAFLSASAARSRR